MMWVNIDEEPTDPEARYWRNRIRLWACIIGYGLAILGFFLSL